MNHLLISKDIYLDGLQRTIELTIQSILLFLKEWAIPQDKVKHEKCKFSVIRQAKWVWQERYELNILWIRNDIV